MSLKNLSKKGSITFNKQYRSVIQPREKHIYTLKVARGELITIDHMKDGSNLDAFLWLKNEYGYTVENNDDGGLGLNSRIFRKVPPGTYQVIAGGLGNSSGSYKLIVNRLKSRVIQVDSTLKGNLRGGQMNMFEFKLPKAGMVTINAKGTENSEVTPYINLKSDTGRFIAQDNNRCDCPCSRLCYIFKRRFIPDIYQ